MSEHHSVIIIGAGLSGLYVAWKLHKQLQDVILLEARDRIGGRILSPYFNNTPEGGIDMGPAWVWPQLQPKLQQLFIDLDIKIFKQFTTGDMLYELNSNTVERHPRESSHSQSYRISGGGYKLIEALQSRLPQSSIHLNTQVTSISQKPLSIQAHREGQNHFYSADKIIIALPLRISQQNITFNPAIPDDMAQLWKNTPTWMASHSKIIFIYDKPFWRDNNLSGEVLSHHGPLSEIYDASPENETFFALTSFVGLNAHQRKQIPAEQLIEQCLAQLQRLFGDAGRDVKDIMVKDWSQDSYTTTEIDLNTPMQHPQYPDNMPRSIWNNRLILAGTEVAKKHGGYLEGALESADEAISKLRTKL